MFFAQRLSCRMNLPNYFLADLPPEATLSPTMVREACQTLKRNRERYLAGRSTQSLVALLSSIANNWLERDYPFRNIALQERPSATGFSPATLARGLDSFFKQLTVENFGILLEQELAHSERLDRLTSTPNEQKQGRAAIVCGPELLVHVTAGNLPVPALMSMVLGVLVRSAQFFKCARGASFLPRLFAHSLYDAEPKLGACLEIAEWLGGTIELEEELFREAGCVTATGSDTALADIQKRVPRTARFVGYGDRVSFGYIAAELLSGVVATRIVARAAADVTAWNQLGCLSPHVFYVQEGAALSPERFAEMLADELERLEQVEPRGVVSKEEAATIASRRSLYEVRAAHVPDTRHWCSKGSTAWTVVYEVDPRFQFSCLNRFIYVKSVKDLTDALHGADAVRTKVSTVGLGVPEHKAEELVVELARWGVTRVCQLGQMQNPPLAWRHDGRPVLADLVTWADWEV
jgi:hypothetical protein